MEASNRKRKRPYPLVLNGISHSFEDRNNDFLCPICFEVIEEAHVTKCGHTFCYKCILSSLELNNRCPKCNFIVDQVFPNFMLNDLISKFNCNKLQKKIESGRTNSRELNELKEVFARKSECLNINDINALLELLSQKKKLFEQTSVIIQNELLNDFLGQILKQKKEQLSHLNRELTLIEEDSKRVKEMISKVSESLNSSKIEGGTSNMISDSTESSSASCSKVPQESDERFNNLNMNKDKIESHHYNLLVNRKKKMQIHFEDLEQCYLNNRAKSLILSDNDSETCNDGLQNFLETLNKFTMYSTLRPLGTLCYTNDPFNGSSIVSSIEFDKDNEIFAIAGVTKKIKLFEFSSVVKDTLDIHYPITEMECNSKISCVSWSSYYKSIMASSDYEGTVTIWDAYTNQKIRTFQEHEKRCWSVDFNKIDTNLVSSGSDDAKVKLWSVNMEHSITSLEAKANVCCVKFNPMTRYHVAFGSADHCVYYYDLRNYKSPQSVFKGHKKAVSYVKFLNGNEIASASTDSQLKMWDTNKAYCQRSFKGHINEKNFVGLATDGDYIACGSENNSLFVYYKGLSKPTLSFWFDSSKLLEKDKREDDTSDFVSSICWKNDTNIIVAANSQGIVKVLELV